MFRTTLVPSTDALSLSASSVRRRTWNATASVSRLDQIHERVLEVVTGAVLKVDA